MIPRLRVWDVKTQQMLFPTVVILDPTTGHIVAIKVSIDCNLVVRTINEVILMYSTGPLDKNSVEIFEGDLFNCIYQSDGCTEHIFQVVYSKESTKFVLKRIGKPCQQTCVVQTVSDVSRYEIIGNIHENPELLQLRAKNETSTHN